MDNHIGKVNWPVLVAFKLHDGRSQELDGGIVAIPSPGIWQTAHPTDLNLTPIKVIFPFLPGQIVDEFNGHAQLPGDVLGDHLTAEVSNFGLDRGNFERVHWCGHKIEKISINLSFFPVDRAAGAQDKAKVYTPQTACAAAPGGTGSLIDKLPQVHR
jgi:hypothetical protein